jgi:hypothetical protein
MGRADTIEADGALKPLLKQVLKEDRKKPPLDGEKGWLRVSALASLCPREEVLCSLGGVVRSDPISADLMMIFEHGHALHWDLQNRVLPKTQTIHGRWRCTMCGFSHGGRDEWEVPLPGDFHSKQAPRPEKCVKCRVEMNPDTCLYVEQWFKHPEFRIAGHPDAFLSIPRLPGLGVFEGKSINPRGAWEVRNCPKLDHVNQAQCYMWLTGCKWAKIVYWDKAGQGLSSLIEHHLEYDEDHVEAIQNLIRDIWTGIQKEKLPERICATPDCKRADLCSVVTPCFEKG